MPAENRALVCDRHPALSAALFAGFLLAVLAPGAFLRDMWVYDEGRRALIALEMYVKRRWAIPSLMGEPILTKPPLFYWLEMISYRCFGGPSDWAARIPSILAGIGGALALAGLLRRIVGLEAGLFGGMALAVSPVYWFMSQQAEPEMVYIAAVIAAAACLFEGFERPRTRPFWHAGFFGLAGVSCLAKGPVAPLALLVAVGAWRAAGKGPLRLARFSWMWGPLVFAAPLALWAAMLARSGHSPLDLWREAATHFNSEADHAKSFGFYFDKLDCFIFPWFFVLAVALLVALGSIPRGKPPRPQNAWRRLKAYGLKDGGGRFFLVLWSLATFLALSVISSKRYYYGLALAPPLCGLLAMAYQDLPWPEGLLDFGPPRRRAIACGLAGAGAAGLLMAGFFVPAPPLWEAFSGRGSLDAKPLLIWGGVVAAGVAVLAWVGPRIGRRVSLWRSALLWILVCSTCMAFAYGLGIHRLINRRWSLKIAAREIAKLLPADAPLFSVGANHTIWFYLGRPDASVIRTSQSLAQYLDSHPNAAGVVCGDSYDLLATAPVEIVYRCGYVPRMEDRVFLVRRALSP